MATFAQSKTDQFIESRPKSIVRKDRGGIVGTLQIGHGSEFHLLRFLGRHRALLNSQLRAQLIDDGVRDVAAIEWLDFPFNSKAPTRDGEILSLDFLPCLGGKAWREYWPDGEPGQANRPGMPSWDAVGRVHYRDARSVEWLLVEAKAHLAEFASPQSACGARGKNRQKIEKALQSAFQALRSPSAPEWESVKDSWLGSYYQMANRLAVLHFLQTQGHSGRLLYVLFAGDSYRECPVEGSGWSQPFAQAYREMGIEGAHSLTTRCHRLCLDVATGQRV